MSDEQQILMYNPIENPMGIDGSLQQNDEHPKRQHLRRPFTAEEDQLLRELVSKMGTSAWHDIEGVFPNRTARQCRERWNHYLNPELDNHTWSQEEDTQLLHYFAVLGPKWTAIAKQFPNRTANSIKNRIKIHLRREARDRGATEPETTETLIQRLRNSVLQGFGEELANYGVTPEAMLQVVSGNVDLQSQSQQIQKINDQGQIYQDQNPSVQ